MADRTDHASRTTGFARLSLGLGRRPSPLVLGLFLLCLILTAIGWHNASTLTDTLARARFSGRTKEISLAIEDRLSTYEMALRGGRAMFAALGQPSRAQWRGYVAKLNIAQHYPGIQGIGYTILVPPSDLRRHEKTVRAEGFPEYAVHPPGRRDIYTAILYLEPFDTRNQKAFGYDMFSEPVRRTAMERARDTGDPAATGRVTLVQETDADVQAGFLLYMPHYEPGVPVFTVEERRAALRGYVYSPFRVNDFMRGVLGKALPGLGLEIYDGSAATEDALLFRSENHGSLRDSGRTPMFELRREVMTYGRPWTLVFRSLPEFEATVDRSVPRMVLAGGICISLLLALFVQSLLGTRARALSLAEAMTFELRESEARLAAVLENAVDAIFTVGGDGLIRSANAAACRIFGYAQEELVGRNVSLLMAEPFRSQHDGYLARYLRTGEPHVLGKGGREVQGLRKDGSSIPLELTVGGMVIGGENLFTGIVRDVSERAQARQKLEQANEALAKNEQFLKSITNNIPGMVGYWNADLSCGFANDAYLLWIGKPLHEVIGKSLPDLLGPEAFSQYERFVRSVLRGEPQHFERELAKADGGLRHALAHYIPDGQAPHVRGFFVLVNDITELKRAQVQLEERQQRLQADLEAAAEIQRSLLPKEGTCSLGLEWDYRFMPSATIGGDIFNVVCLGPQHTGLYMVDVSGHGVPAALVSVSVAQELSLAGNMLMDTLTQQPRSPETVLRLLDEAFPIERFDKFFSMFYMVYETRGGMLAYCNAGHPAPMLLRSDGRTELLEDGGTLVGMGMGNTYALGRAVIGDGDLLLIYTDGVTELENPDGEQFGEVRLWEVFSECVGWTPQLVLDRTVGTLQAHADGRPPDDDISIMCVRFTAI